MINQYQHFMNNMNLYSAAAKMGRMTVLSKFILILYCLDKFWIN